MEIYKGKISNLVEDKGFGFIEYEQGEDNIFLHSSNMEANSDFSSLRKGMDIEFRIRQGNRGLEAYDCKIVDRLDEINNFFREYALIAPSDEHLYDKFCDLAEEYAKKLEENNVTTSNIRNIYSSIVLARNAMDLKQLRPRFAYTSGRNAENLMLREFMELLDSIVRSMKVEDNETEVKNFKKFMEAIVAYRKFAGRDN